MKTRSLVFLFLGLYIFSPTFYTWMINPNGSWYRPFIIWAVVIVIAFVLQSKTNKTR
ncbi:MAG: hypothetical protein ACRBCS_06905 [Cellvibrionaceae bacterium]